MRRVIKICNSDFVFLYRKANILNISLRFSIDCVGL